MKKTAQKIRNKLKEIGYSNREVSVRCTWGFKILVETKCDYVDLKKAKDATLSAYHADPHHWLCVSFNGSWLPMPPIRQRRDDGQEATQRISQA